MAMETLFKIAEALEVPASKLFEEQKYLKVAYMLNSLFKRQKQNPEQEQAEYIRYTQEVDGTLRILEAQLHESDDSDEIIHNVMKTACEFIKGIGWAFWSLTLN